MRLPFLAFALSLLACSSKDSSTAPATTPKRAAIEPPVWNADCDVLVPEHCGFPFPSNTALIDDATTKTGKRVKLKQGALPLHNGVPTDPKTWDDHDGFSPNQTLITLIPYATTAGLPTQDDIGKSITKDSPTIVMDAATGELIPHFSELDVTGKSGDDKTFMIRPVVRLKSATRYIVAIRHVLDPDGATIPASPAFTALRDGTPLDAIESRRAAYQDIFGILDKNGIGKSDLQIAWDFTTASRENITSAMVKMRDEALATVGAEGPTYTISKVEDAPNEYIWKRITAKMTVPLYLEQGATAPTKMTRNPDGTPKQNGTAEFEVLIHVPNAAKDKPCALLQQGHGLLGEKTEGQNGVLAKRAQDGCFVAFAVDLVGMAHDDQTAVSDAVVKDIGTFKDAVDRQHQGLLNSLLAMRMMKTRFVTEPLIQNGGHSAIDPTRCFYRGDSQGGIFGSTYMALSTDVTRGVLGEPGAPYSLLLHRSEDFGPFFFLLGTVYQDAYDLDIVLGLVQMMWDRTEPGGYIDAINASPLPGTPKHDVLIHAALGDHQVTPLGAHVIARAVGAKSVSPALRPIFGIQEATPPFMGSAIVEWDFPSALADQTPKENVPPTKGEDPHDMVRDTLPAEQQEIDFLLNGTVVQHCDGKCDPG
ncbi:MAG: hypothetical protein ACXVEF_00150 [Polyangiales bacterium]